MVGNGIQQGYALHLRTAGLLPEKLHGVTTGERWVDNQHVRFVRAKCLLQKLRSGNFDIWMRNPGSRFNTASSPLRMIADGSAIAMFNKVLIGITVLFFRELRSPARKGSLLHGCGMTGLVRLQKYQTGRCLASCFRGPDNI